MVASRLSRRDMLKTSAALAASVAAPYVITSTALGDDQTPPASDRITVGHIGVGGRGRALFRDTTSVKQAQIVAVSDCYRDRRENMATVCQGKAKTSENSWRERTSMRWLSPPRITGTFQPQSSPLGRARGCRSRSL